MKNLKKKFAIVLTATGLVFSLNMAEPALAQEEDKVVFTVNGQKIRASEIAIAKDEVLPHLGGLPPKARFPFIVDYLIERHLLAQAAVSAQINKTEAYKKRLRYYQVKALREAYFAEKIRPRISKEKVRETYEREKKNTKPKTRARARHILVKDEKTAKELFVKAKQGDDFALLARNNSTDEAAPQGGDLGYFFPEEMVSEFSDVVFKLKPGQIGGPIKTKYGWHVVKVVDFQTIGPKRFEDVEEGVTAILLRQEVQDEIAKFKKRSKIEYLDPDLIKVRAEIQKRIDAAQKQQEKKQ